MDMHRLTDEESRKNWEEYGNPDGPQGVPASVTSAVSPFSSSTCLPSSLSSPAATFGIALPSWIVDKKNSGLVLGLYILVFMVALPVAIVSGCL